MLDQAPEYLALSSADRQELGFGSGMTCWRRLRDWQADGIWERLHLALLTRLRASHDQIDWTRASIDGAAVASPPGANRQARTLRTAANSAANAISS
ncbi:transposase [Cupriavidus sp. UYMU48A]|nr:transposase [Cupriavidus sp. UYMU48A]